jgi:patatin-related protein
MESELPDSQPTFSREVRLGLVAYSGISLSIYTSGVCQEFYRAVRGRGIYKLLKALVDADVIVDTLSGTSVGGINGVLLGYALTNSTDTETVDFNTFSEVWQNSGDIYQLLRQSPVAAGATSDGDGYQQQQLEAAFINAFQRRIPPPEREWISPFRELDLFVTGTDFWGKTYRTFDGSGAITEVQDHHGLFHLKHRQGRKEPFNPLSLDLAGAKPQHTFQALAKLCRLTSALPMVFPMVQIDLNNSQNLIDRQLGIWGQLDQRTWQHRLEGKQISFLDGGLLDNAPFMPATRAIHYRTPNRWTQRVLFYIDPTPKKWSEQAEIARVTPAKSPQVRARVLDIPMYHSVVTDLRHLQEHNQKVQRYQELLAHAEASLNIPTHNTELQIQKNIYLRSRLINLRAQVIPQLLCLAAGGDSGRQAETERVARLLTHHHVGQAAKEQREECLQNFAPQMTQLDVDYSLRQHLYLTHKIHEQLITTQSPNDRFYLEVLIKQIGQSIQLLAVIKAGLQKLWSNLVISDNFYAMLGVKKSDYFLRPLVYEYIFRLHRYFLDVQALPLSLPTLEDLPEQLDEMGALSELFLNLPLTANEMPGGWLPSEQISMIWQQLQQKIEILAAAASEGQYIWNKNRFHYDQRGNQRFLSMLTQIESATTMLLYNSPAMAAPSLLQKFQSFEHLDQVLYPFEYLTDLEQKEPLSTVRISPATAQLGWGQGKSEQEKLAGDDFYVNGGLFKKSWRSNDFLWGRLDGLNRIIEGIVSPVTVKCFSGLVQRESIRLSMTADDYLEFLIRESLPNLVGQEHRQLKSHLTYLAQPGLEITADRLHDLLNDLVMAGHRQLVDTDLDRVFRAAAVQHQHWANQLSQALTQDPLQSSMMQMAQEITQESLHHLTTEQEQFFRKQYKIGSEKLFENTPGMVWINWTSRLVLALRDIFVNFGGQRRSEKLRQNALYRLVGTKGDRLLQAWYWWLQSQGTKLVLKISFQPLRLLLRGLLVLLLILSVLLSTYNSLIWLVVAVMSLVGWAVVQQRSWMYRQQHRPRQFQKLLTVKSLIDR